MGSLVGCPSGWTFRLAAFLVRAAGFAGVLACRSWADDDDRDQGLMNEDTFQSKLTFAGWLPLALCCFFAYLLCEIARGFARRVCAHARDTQQLTERTRQLAVSLAEQSSKVAVNVNADALLKELSAVLAIVDPLVKDHNAPPGLSVQKPVEKMASGVSSEPSSLLFHPVEMKGQDGRPDNNNSNSVSNHNTCGSAAGSSSSSTAVRDPSTQALLLVHRLLHQVTQNIREPPAGFAGARGGGGRGGEASDTRTNVSSTMQFSFHARPSGFSNSPLNPLVSSFRSPPTRAASMSRALMNLSRTIDVAPASQQPEGATQADLTLTFADQQVTTSAGALLKHVVLMCLDQDLNILHWGEKLAECTGFSADGMVGKNLMSYVNDEAEQARLEACAADARTGRTTAPATFTMSTLHNNTALLLSFQPCSVSSGEISPMSARGAKAQQLPRHRTVIVACGRDLGLETNVARYTAWLFSRAKQQVFGVAKALEFLAEEEPGFYGPVLQMAHTAKSVIERFEPLCQSLTDVSFGAWVPLNILKLLEDVAANYEAERRSANYTARLATSVAEDTKPDVYLDRDRIFSVLCYLARMVAAESCEMCTVEVAAGRDDDGSTLIFRVRQTCAAETATAIVPLSPYRTQHLSTSLFGALPAADPFAANDEDGVGLAKVKLGVQQLGGTIVVDDAGSVSGTLCKAAAGSGFTIYLPCLPAETGEPGESGRAQRTSGAFAVRSLILEQTAVERYPILHAMWRRGHSTTVYLEDLPIDISDFDVVIFDPSLPASHGLQNLLEKAKECPQIILTYSTPEPPPPTEATRGKKCLFLRKPIRVNQLVLALKEAERLVYRRRKEKDALLSLRETFGQAGCPWARAEKLGQGAFSEVFKATNLYTNGVMAVKILDISGKPDDELKHIFNEVQLLSDHRHDNIIHYFYCERGNSNNELYIFMEYSSGGSLADLVAYFDYLDTNTTACCLLDVLSALEYLHGRGVIHRDIKSAN
eukprot:gene19971-30725_t